jgi:hypothetical protein
LDADKNGRPVRREADLSVAGRDDLRWNRRANDLRMHAYGGDQRDGQQEGQTKNRLFHG